MLFLTLILVAAAGLAGFFAGVKHAEKARAVKDAIRK